MTRQEIGNRVRDELDVFEDGRGLEATSVENLDELTVSIDAALDECRGFLEQQFSAERLKESR